MTTLCIGDRPVLTGTNNEDKAIVRREFLVSVTNPEGATSMDKIESAVEEWDTNIRLFVAANGEAPTEEAKRTTLIQM